MFQISYYQGNSLLSRCLRKRKLRLLRWLFTIFHRTVLKHNFSNFSKLLMSRMWSLRIWRLRRTKLTTSVQKQKQMLSGLTSIEVSVNLFWTTLSQHRSKLRIKNNQTHKKLHNKRTKSDSTNQCHKSLCRLRIFHWTVHSFSSNSCATKLELSTLSLKISDLLEVLQLYNAQLRKLRCWWRTLAKFNSNSQEWIKKWKRLQKTSTTTVLDLPTSKSQCLHTLQRWCTLRLCRNLNQRESRFSTRFLSKTLIHSRKKQRV